MKKLFSIFIFISTSINAVAGIGGSSGGAAAFTAEVCQTNEAGQQFGCRKIKFNRELGLTSDNLQRFTCLGEAQDTVCDRPNVEVPDLMGKINDWFKRQGYANPDSVQDDPPIDFNDQVGG